MIYSRLATLAKTSGARSINAVAKSDGIRGWTDHKCDSEVEVDSELGYERSLMSASLLGVASPCPGACAPLQRRLVRRRRLAPNHRSPHFGLLAGVGLIMYTSDKQF